VTVTDVVIAIGGGALSYLVGSVPFGYLAGRLVAGVDIRRHGSGNIGATNAARVIGGAKGVLVFLVVFVLDLGKGVAAAWGLASAVRGLTGTNDPAAIIGIVYGLSAIAGHVFPVWLRFRGGKAVATSCGVMFALAPLETAGAFAVWVVVLGVTRIVSLSSILAAAGLLAARFARLGNPWRRTDLPLTLMVFLVAALVIIRHRANMRRLLAGTEPHFGTRRPDPARPTASTGEQEGNAPTVPPDSSGGGPRERDGGRNGGR